MKFRVHHILCTALYQGYGYSGLFCDNMTRLVTELKDNRDKTLILVTDPDAICENCPNLNREDATCSGNHNHVHEKDTDLLKVLGLSEGERYSYRELERVGAERFTKDIFEESCKICEWYQAGFCSWEEFQKNAFNIAGHLEADEKHSIDHREKEPVKRTVIEKM